MSPLEVIAIVAGAFTVLITMWSAMLTVVVPRSERPKITRWHFRVITGLTYPLTARISDPETQDRFEARVAPFGLATLPFLWAFQIVVGFAAMFWGLGVRGVGEALVLSGSSLTTLGFRDVEGFVPLELAVVEAFIGLGLVALMISYMPTIYRAYTDREIAVARLEVRAGRPPHPITFLFRTSRIGGLEEMDLHWSEWEDWFLEIEETHTTHSSLAFFHSAYYGRSWLAAAGTVLDTAALWLTTIDVEASPQAALCLRSGFTTIGSIADGLGIEHPADPHWPRDQVSIERASFDALCAKLVELDVPLVDDLDEAWKHFCGWRVNYDASMFGLFRRLRMEPGDWLGHGSVNPTDLSRVDDG